MGQRGPSLVATSQGTASQASAGSALLYLTYGASGMHLRGASATYRKLQRVLADLGQHQPRYDFVLLYQRNRAQDPFNCTQHAPTGTAACAEYTRADLKRAFGAEMSLSRRDNKPSRANVGFWVCALWMMQEQKAHRIYPFVWYVEDDVLLTGSWFGFLSRYDTSYAWADLLVPQMPYTLDGQARASGAGGTVNDLDLVHGGGSSVPGAAGQLSIPRSTLPTRLPVTSESHYAKVPLYVWRMSDRLVVEVVRALRRGARAHEEYLVPTVCNARLQQPGCRWKMMDTDDLGVPCASNQENAWQRSLRAEFRAPPRGGLNRTAFHRLFAQLQRPGGHHLLPGAPQRLYHPVKGQLTSAPNGARGPAGGGVRKGNRTRNSVGSRTREHGKRTTTKPKIK